MQWNLLHLHFPGGLEFIFIWKFTHFSGGSVTEKALHSTAALLPTLAFLFMCNYFFKWAIYITSHNFICFFSLCLPYSVFIIYLWFYAWIRVPVAHSLCVFVVFKVWHSEALQYKSYGVSKSGFRVPQLCRCPSDHRQAPLYRQFTALLSLTTW